jgi:hypothetical protein
LTRSALRRCLQRHGFSRLPDVEGDKPRRQKFNRYPKRFHCDRHDPLQTHLADFTAAHTFTRRLKTLGGLTPPQYICKIWTSGPATSILNPIHQMPGLNS